MLPRFFAPGALNAHGGEFELPADEAHHASRVMRLSAGDEIAVFDGAGHEWRARVESTTRGRVQVHLLEALKPSPEPRVRIVLVHAVLKGDHMDAVVRDATMMGVAAIQPIVTAHTIARAGASAATRLRDRWMRVAIASVKQCRRAVVPEIASPIDVAAIDAAVTGESRQARFVLVEPAAGVQAASVAQSAAAPPDVAVIAVGPEGGWSPDEVTLLTAAGFKPVTLGPLTLRADAAALVAISAFRAVWRE